ncbi:hypothetical protein T439DRAFT_326019 [Meredithblackwellia eburnea MCA 4105]
MTSGTATPTLEDPILSSLSPTEKCLVAQAVYQTGNAEYDKAAQLLLAHPLLIRDKKPKDFLNTTKVKEVYDAMLRDPAMQLDPNESYQPSSAPLLKVAKKYYMARVVELRGLMQLEQDKFRITYAEIQEIRSGGWDDKMAGDKLAPKLKGAKPPPAQGGRRSSRGKPSDGDGDGDVEMKTE